MSLLLPGFEIDCPVRQMLVGNEDPNHSPQSQLKQCSNKEEREFNQYLVVYPGQDLNIFLCHAV